MRTASQLHMKSIIFQALPLLESTTHCFSAAFIIIIKLSTVTKPDTLLSFIKLVFLCIHQFTTHNHLVTFSDAA
jgi:hypothetical protein